MFRAYTRLALLLAALLLSLAYLLRDEYAQAVYLLIAALLLGLSHIWFGNIGQAYTAIRRGHTQMADRILAMILWPRWLLPRPRAYYYFIRGMLHLHANRLEEGAEALQKALKGPLREGKDKALATLNLAHIAYLRQDLDACKKRIVQVEEMGTNDLLIKEHLDKLKRTELLRQS